MEWESPGPGCGVEERSFVTLRYSWVALALLVCQGGPWSKPSSLQKLGRDDDSHQSGRILIRVHIANSSALDLA